MNKEKTSDEKAKPKVAKYNEKNTTKEFMLSDKGIPFLIRVGADFKFYKNNQSKDIENLIDFYCTWTSTFPVRKNLKMSKYDYLKSVEDFCLNRENAQFFEFLFE